MTVSWAAVWMISISEGRGVPCPGMLQPARTTSASMMLIRAVRLLFMAHILLN
jgi:hypothetical protein